MNSIKLTFGVEIFMFRVFTLRHNFLDFLQLLKLTDKASMLEGQEPSLWVKIEIIRHGFSHFIKVPPQIVLPVNITHSWKVVHLLMKGKPPKLIFEHVHITPKHIPIRKILIFSNPQVKILLRYFMNYWILAVRQINDHSLVTLSFPLLG